MALIILLLLFLGLAFFVAGTFGLIVRINPVAAGLACWILATILGALLK